jgi:hypothetical protein
MKIDRQLTIREKGLSVVILILAVSLVMSNPIQAAFDHRIIQHSDRELYESFYNAAENGDMALALMYLYAYIQRNPTEYADNTNGNTANIENAYSSLLASVQDNERFANSVSAHLDSCNKYPCGNEQAGLGTSFNRVFPSNMVKVCEGYNLEGKCAYLQAGEYTQWQQLGVANDEISSIFVGKDVEITLCVHSLAHKDECLLFTNVDLDLRDNTIPGHGYSIDNNVSTANITLNPFPGLTPP